MQPGKNSGLTGGKVEDSRACERAARFQRRVPGPVLLSVMVFNFRDGGKGYLDDLAVSAFHLYAGSRECLSGFHAANYASHALSVQGHDLHVVFPEKRLQSRKCFSNFHVDIPPEFIAPKAHELV